MIVVLALTAGLAGYLFWRLTQARQALKRLEGELESYRQDRAIRHNLQRILNARDGEIRRLRLRIRQNEDEAQALEEQATQLNLSLFHESSLRILREKEEGARRMKLDLMERQLDEANAGRREDRAAAKQREQELLEIIDRQQQRLDKLGADRTHKPRRARQEVELDQVTFDDLLAPADGAAEPASPFRHISGECE